MIEGAKILSPSGEEALGKQLCFVFFRCWSIRAFNTFPGIITSGIPSPTLGRNISMGYIKSGWHKKGTEVVIEVRKQLRKAVTTPMPFSKTNYWRG